MQETHTVKARDSCWLSFRKTKMPALGGIGNRGEASDSQMKRLKPFQHPLGASRVSRPTNGSPSGRSAPASQEAPGPCEHRSSREATLHPASMGQKVTPSTRLTRYASQMSHYRNKKAIYKCVPLFREPLACSPAGG